MSKFHGPYTENLIDFAAVAPIINPLAAQIDVALWGSLGLGSLQADLSARLQAAIQASVDLGLHISNPYIGFQAALEGVVQLQAQIMAALSGAIPAVSIDASAQLAANAALIADLELRLGGLNAMLDAVLKVKLPAVNLVAGLRVGPVTLLAWEDEPKSEVLMEITKILDSSDYSGANTYGVLLLTKSPDAYAGIASCLIKLP